MRILVIDDDESIVDLLFHVLSSSGYHDVSTALSAKEALEKLADAQEPFDCFLVDIQMPEIDGIVLTDLIRQTPGYDRQPIIMVTAMHQKNYLDAAFKAGVTDFVTKPFDLMEIRTRVQEAQKLAYEKLRLYDRPYMEGEMKGLGGEPKEVRFDQPLSIRDVRSAIDFREFENYIVQLSHRGSFKAKVFAVTIEDINPIYAGSSSEEFTSLICNVAKAAQDALLDDGGILSYRGKGTFLCVDENRSKKSQRVQEVAINGRLAELHPASGTIPIKLVVGDAVTLKPGSEALAIDSLSRAIDNAEIGSFLHRNNPAFSLQIRRLLRFSREHELLTQRSYEILLHDIHTGLSCISQHLRSTIDGKAGAKLTRDFLFSIT